MILNKKGFTLIELLVVIAIIGILSTLAVIALSSARTKARDSKRMSDIKQIGTALELYYAENNAYPENITPGNSIVSPDGQTTYMNKIPSNPNPRTDGGCLDKDYEYTYSSNTSYTLTACIGSSVNSFSPGAITYTPSGFIGGSGGGGSVAWACGDNVSYGGEDYPTVEIGTQCWFKKNLNIGTRIDGIPSGQADADGSNIEKYCRENSDVNCNNYGGLYQWHTAMAFKQICDNHDNTSPCVPDDNHRGICPTGWHIPTFNEYQTLAQNADPGCEINCENGACDCNTAGTKLKAVSWSGTDDYGFSALPSRQCDSNGYCWFPVDKFFVWSALPDSSNGNSWLIFLELTPDPKAYSSYSNRSGGYSVRCLKN